MIAFIICIVAAIIIGCVLLGRFDVTIDNHGIIYCAIRLYQKHYTGGEYVNLNGEYGVFVNDIEDFTKTYWRLWDWGYSRILPPEKYELIKPYIDVAKEYRNNVRKQHR